MPSHGFFLPNHPSLTSLDPLGICEDGEDSVNHFALCKALLTTASESFEEVEVLDTESEEDFRRGWCKVFTNLLKDIAYSLHDGGHLATAGLEIFLKDSSKICVTRLRHFRTALFSHAFKLDRPDLPFADGNLDQLSSGHTSVRLSPEATDTLLAHMILGTLPIPAGNTWGRPGFTELFSHPSTVSHAYLQTLFTHFAEGGYSRTDPSGHATFDLHNASTMPDLKTSNLPAAPLPTKVVTEPSENCFPPHSTDFHFLLVAAHSQPGPGPNGTQEERLVGQSPALALISLLKALLQADEAVITSGLWAHSSWTGHARQARMTRLFDAKDRPLVRYIVADALELDIEDRSEVDGRLSLPDLQAGNVEREVRKLFAGFSGAREAWKRNGREEKMKIEVPPWGCGAFGGNLAVKVQCMMMAAAIAGLGADTLELVVTADRASELNALPKSEESVSEMYARLTGASGLQSNV